MPMDTSELESAYRAVLDLAAGPRADPGPGGADPVLNDRLLARAVRSVLEGATQPYDNAPATGLAELRHLGERLGGTAGLIRALEASSRELVELAGRLDQAQGDTRVPARIVDGDETRVDRPIPVAGLLTIQARAHLPMHERQLSELLGRP
jgi:hypothetical protein